MISDSRRKVGNMRNNQLAAQPQTLLPPPLQTTTTICTIKILFSYATRRETIYIQKEARARKRERERKRERTIQEEEEEEERRYNTLKLIRRIY